MRKDTDLKVGKSNSKRGGMDKGVDYDWSCESALTFKGIGWGSEGEKKERLDFWREIYEIVDSLKKKI